VHLAIRDVTLGRRFARAAGPRSKRFKRKRMGWRFQVGYRPTEMTFNRGLITSSFTKEEMAAGKAYYNYEANGPFRAEEGPGGSVCSFHRGNEIFPYIFQLRGAGST